MGSPKEAFNVLSNNKVSKQKGLDVLLDLMPRQMAQKRAHKGAADQVFRNGNLPFWKGGELCVQEKHTTRTYKWLPDPPDAAGTVGSGSAARRRNNGHNNRGDAGGAGPGHGSPR